MTNILTTALRERFPKHSSTEPTLLAGDASNRQFYLVHTDAGEEVLCIDPQNELLRYYEATLLYKKLGIPCPEITYLSKDHSFMFMTFGGPLYLNEHPLKDSLELKCLQAIAPLWKSSHNFKLAPMDGEFLIKEFSSLEHLFVTTSAEMEWKEFKKNLLSELKKIPLENCHRDFHSRNIMFQIGHNDPCIIDIQDSRLGPKHYDLASFLVDPYQDLGPQTRQEIFDAFNLTPSNKAFQTVFYQRGIKAINTYVKMCVEKKKTFYFPFIKGALKNICTIYPDFSKTYPGIYKTLWNFQVSL